MSKKFARKYKKLYIQITKQAHELSENYETDTNKRKSKARGFLEEEQNPVWKINQVIIGNNTCQI